MKHSDIFGNRWGENSDALAFEDCFKQSSPSKQIKARHMIQDELEHLIPKHARVSHISIVGASALDLLSFRLNRSKLVSASQYVIDVKDEETADVAISQFSKFVSDAIDSLSESDDQISKSAAAVDEALIAADKRKRLSIEQITAVYLPLVTSSIQRLYEIAGSGQHKLEEIFPESDCHDIAHERAIEWRRNHR